MWGARGCYALRCYIYIMFYNQRCDILMNSPLCSAVDARSV